MQFVRTTDPHPPRPRGRYGSFLRMAEALRADTAVQASGRCLGLSLDLCAAAQQMGIEVNLVVWSVANDASYADHWAVAMSDTKVIDLTRVQVDGRTAIKHNIQDYPKNFVKPRIYPASLLLPAYTQSRTTADGRIGARFMWRARWLLFVHDLRRACHRVHPVNAIQAVLRLVRFFLIHPLQRFRCLLEARREELKERIARLP